MLNLSRPEEHKMLFPESDEKDNGYETEEDQSIHVEQLI